MRQQIPGRVHVLTLWWRSLSFNHSAIIPLKREKCTFRTMYIQLLVQANRFVGCLCLCACCWCCCSQFNFGLCYLRLDQSWKWFQLYTIIKPYINKSHNKTMHDWTAVINQMPKKNGAYSVNLSDWSGKIAFNSNHTEVTCT